MKSVTANTKERTTRHQKPAERLDETMKSKWWSKQNPTQNHKPVYLDKFVKMNDKKYSQDPRFPRVP